MQNKPQNLQYRICSALDPNLVLDCAPNGKLVLWKWHKGANQKWTLSSNGQGLSKFTNIQHHTVLKTHNSDNGTQASC